MLARRFTIVCLLMTLFGMAFAILVAEASRTGRHYRDGRRRSCLLEPKIFCRPREPRLTLETQHDESEVKTMTRPLSETLKCLRLLPRALVVMLVVAAPVLAVPAIRAADQHDDRSPAMKKTGAGFVLMVSLQRA